MKYLRKFNESSDFYEDISHDNLNFISITGNV